MLYDMDSSAVQNLGQKPFSLLKRGTSPSIFVTVTAVFFFSNLNFQKPERCENSLFNNCLSVLKAALCNCSIKTKQKEQTSMFYYIVKF